MLQAFTILSKLFSLPTGETQHPLSSEDYLLQAMKGRNYLFLNLTIATSQRYQVNLDLRMNMSP